jgi:hypothetical protein
MLLSSCPILLSPGSSKLACCRAATYSSIQGTPWILGRPASRRSRPCGVSSSSSRTCTHLCGAVAWQRQRVR